jgi:transcriptional regulator with XRE-family HTH domain
MAGRRGIHARRIVAGNVRRLRRARKMSQEELADAPGISQSQVSSVENANLNFKFDVLWRLAGALGVRMADLVDETKRE